MRRFRETRPDGGVPLVSSAREMTHNGTPIRVFEFYDPEVTGTEAAVLILADDWEVYLIAECFPPNWRELRTESLLRALLHPVSS